jgi:hypothetical protein
MVDKFQCEPVFSKFTEEIIEHLKVFEINSIFPIELTHY